MGKKKKAEGTVATVAITLTIEVPVEEGESVDFGPLVAALEDAASELLPGAVIAEAEGEAGQLPGHSERLIELTDAQWETVERLAKRSNLSPSEWLRRFLTPYLRRG